MTRRLTSRRGAAPASALRLAFAALAASFAAAPAAMAQPLPLNNAYNLSGRINPPADTWLTSYVECGRVRCDIAYSIVTRPLDRLVKVVWKDTANQPLVSGSNAYLSNFYDPQDFTGYIEATEWSKGPLIGGPPPAQAVGTADFTGTSPGVAPCAAGYVCNDADYYYWPSMWGTPPPGNPAPGLRQTSAAAPINLGTITGTLSNVGIDVDRPGDVGDRRVAFIGFTSSVDYDTDHYVYRYAVSNSTDLRIPFAWSEAGLNGTIDAFSTVQREFVSITAPGVFSSLPSWTLTTEPPFPFSVDFANSLEIFAPVPEPGRWLQLALGLGLMGLIGLARRQD